MKIITANVVYTVAVVIRVKNKAKPEDIIEALKVESDYIMEQTAVKVEIKECNIPELNDPDDKDNELDEEDKNCTQKEHNEAD